MTTKSNNNTKYNTFCNLLDSSQKGITEKLASSEGLVEAIKSKNLFQSLRSDPDLSVSQYLHRTFHLPEVKKYEFGSAFCFLEDLKAAARSLLEDAGTSEEECSLLEKWMQATELTLEISCFFDDSRTRIPSVIDSVVKGQDPQSALSIKERIFIHCFSTRRKRTGIRMRLYRSSNRCSRFRLLSCHSLGKPLS